MKKSRKYILPVLSKMGIENLTPMQDDMIDNWDDIKDIILLSPTGSGKTLAFLLPLLISLDPDIQQIQAIILCPSRELALQIESVFRNMGTDFKVNSAYGGHSKRTELNNFSSPPAVLTGTPGRIMDHIKSASFDVSHVKTLILDEFDKSLELGFKDEMSFIISKLDSVRKKILCSATQLAEIPAFTNITAPKTFNYLLEYTIENNLSISIVRSPDKDKLDCLLKLLCTLDASSTLIFCNHRESVERISKHLNQAGIVNDYFHGGLEQDERERMLVRFRNGSSQILITTDLAARGLDIPDISYIIHYQLPVSKEGFLHRNGRTARMNARGSSYLILQEGEDLPDYAESDYPVFKVNPDSGLPKKPVWQTLYISGGRKDKISKMDIAGFLYKQGGLNKDQLGYIEIKDHHSYVAIKRDLIQTVLQKVRNHKIKNKKLKMEISY
ncbi:MAG: DEAD/DEAH box helicase [Bacteroidales bacterium]|nr:DEAD/DEAH box helicase [Bacteroidales bacterium]